MKSAARKWSSLVLAVFAFVGLVLFQAHSKQVESQRIAERDSRCAKHVATPPAPLRSDLGCLGWKGTRSDIPLPAQG